jgi:glycosyltransferase involved in cell wall biosynthesis
MAVFNGERYLNEVISSVLCQTYGDFEFVIVDDGSTDCTEQIVRGHTDSRIRLIKLAKNMGLPAALNRGIDVSSGSYIARVDADDPSFPYRFERQVQFLDAHPDILAVGGAIVVVNEAGRRLCVLRHPSTPEEIRKTLPEYNCFFHSAMMIRRTALEQVGGYREQFLYAQDCDLWLRMNERGDLANLEDQLVTRTFRVDSPSLGRRYVQKMFSDVARDLASQRRTQGEDELQRTGRCVGLEEARRTAAEPIDRNQFSNSCLHWARFFHYQGCRKETIRLARIAFARCPANVETYRFVVGLASGKLQRLLARKRGV